MSLATSEILQKMKIVTRLGDVPEKIEGICSPQRPRPGHMVFCRNIQDIETLSGDSLLVVCESATQQQMTERPYPTVVVENLQLCFVTALRHVDMSIKSAPSGIDENAKIDSSAQIGEEFSLGAFSTIGKNTHIGNRCSVSHGVNIGNNVTIGSDVKIHASVFIGDDCVIGSGVEIHPNTTIGSDGFGYLPGPDGHQKIPQLGNVVIEDDVEIGANCAIDRATLDSTIIGRGTKLDNLVHVAHNCSFGEHCMITAGYMTGGSTSVGDHVVTGGHVTVKDHIEIASEVTIGGFSGVTNSIKQKGVYAGYPARPIKEFLKIQSSLAFLPKLLSTVRKLKKAED